MGMKLGTVPKCMMSSTDLIRLHVGSSAVPPSSLSAPALRPASSSKVAAACKLFTGLQELGQHL